MSIDNVGNENIIDVDYDEVENILYLSAPQLAKKIGTTEATIRTWADVYGDLIGIEKINGRKTYKETQVSCFAFIKDLVDNKNMKRTQVRNYISKHGFKYAEYNSGLINPKDPLGFEALASALSVEVSNKLNVFAEELLINVSNQLNEHLVKQYQMNIENKAEIEASVNDIMDSKFSNILENQQDLNQIHQQNKQDFQEFVAITIDSNIKSAIDTIEQETTKRLNSSEEILKQHMEEKKNYQKLLEDIETQNKNKSLWQRIRNK